MAGAEAAGQLGAQRLVVEQEGHVGVCGVAREYFDMSGDKVVRAPIGNVAVERFEVGLSRGVPLLPPLGEPGGVVVVAALELLAVVGGAGGALVQVIDESGF